MATRIRRINLFGGPGSGKSSIASLIFARLKERRSIALARDGADSSAPTVELVREWHKEAAWTNRPHYRFDEVFSCGEQMRREYELLENGVDLIVTDSPVLLSSVYARKPAAEDTPTRRLSRDYVGNYLQGLSAQFDREYPCINYVLRRGSRPYDPKGRRQTPEEAMEMDRLIANELFLHDPVCRVVFVTDLHVVVDAVITDVHKAMQK